MRYQVHGATIHVPGGRRQFERRIREVADLGTIVVVLLDPDEAPLLSENVCAVDAAANVVWRVEPHEFPSGRTPYSGVNALEGGLSVYHPTGFEAFLDARTGRIINMRFIK